MAEEPTKPAEQVVAAMAEELVTEKPIPEKERAEPVKVEKPKDDVVVAIEEETISQSVSFKEESNVVGELPEAQKKAVEELKFLIQDALNKHDFTEKPAPLASEESKIEIENAETVESETVTSAALAEKKEEEAEVVKEEKPASASEEPKIEIEKGETENVIVTGVEAVVVTEVEEKLADVDEDGAKTGEAIKESIVSVSATEKKEEEAAPPSTTVNEAAPAEAEHKAPEEVSIWGIPLLADDRSDLILLKFLRARDFKVKEAFTMIKNTVRWRKEFGIDALVEEDLANDWDNVVFTHGYDRKGHPVCYNVFGEFENKELYQNTFSDEEKRQKFIRWRIQFLEKSVRKLEYSSTGVATIFQVNDLKNSPGLLGKRELRQSTNHALQLLQDNYPEFVAKQMFINVPWWYLAFSRMISPFLTQRTKSKFVFAGPSKSAETLFKSIAPELVPVQYGGLSREGDQEFSTSDPVREVTIKPAIKHVVELLVSEASHVVWEVRVVGWDVSYGAEFVPGAEDGYTVIVQKSRKISPADETVINNSFKIGEPGKVVLTIDNQTSRKKKLLYRSKTKLISE